MTHSTPLLLSPKNGQYLPFGRNQKERKFKGCVLKNPSHCTELLCSIKNDRIVFAEITGRALRNEIVRNRKRTTSRGDRWSPAPTAGVAVKRNFDDRNPFSHYPCYAELTSSAHEPSPRGEGGPRRRWMRCAHAFGMGECAVTNSVDVTSSAALITQHKISPHQNRSLRLRLLRRRHQRCGRMRTDKCG